MLLVDGTFMVSLLLSARKNKNKGGSQVWVLEPSFAERDFITLICTMNRTHDRVNGYFLLPHMQRFRAKVFHDGYLQRAQRLRSLADFYAAVKSCGRKDHVSNKYGPIFHKICFVPSQKSTHLHSVP